MINFVNIFITPPKTFQFDLGVAGKEILTLSALYRSCQFLPLSDRTNTCGDDFVPMVENQSSNEQQETKFSPASLRKSSQEKAARVCDASYTVDNIECLKEAVQNLERIYETMRSHSPKEKRSSNSDKPGEEAAESNDNRLSQSLSQTTPPSQT